MKHLVLSLWLCLFLGTIVHAQTFGPNFNLLDTSQVHVLQTKNGDRFIGRVLHIEQTELTFLFRNTQELRFQFTELDQVSVLGSNTDQTIFRPTYLSIFPTAYNYQKDQWEYQNVDLLWNTLNYGITDHLSIGGGFIIPIAFLLRFKASTPLADGFDVALNTQTIVPLVEDASPFTLMTLVGTLGSPERLLNIGVGYGFAWGEDFDLPVYFVSLGGNVHFSDRIGVNGELNLGFSDGDTFAYPSVSMSYFGKQNRLSLGLVLDPSFDILGLIGFPLVSYNQRF